MAAEHLMKHDNNFDLLRIFAAFLVWYEHSFTIVAIPEPSFLLGYEDSGKLGVTIFFIISGYFITQSYQRSNTITHYARNRLLRVMPALVVLVIITVFAVGPGITSNDLYFYNNDTWKYLKCILIFPVQYTLPGVFTNNVFNVVNGSLWTLQHEVRLYIAIGVLGAMGLLRPAIMLGILAVLMGFRIYGYWLKPTDIVLAKKWGDLELLIRLASEFTIGSVFYLLGKEVLQKLKPAIPIFIIIIGLTMMLPVVLGNVVFDIIFAYLLLIVGFSKNTIKLPDISYGFYLYAFLVQQICWQYLGHYGFIWYCLVSLVCTVICALCSWYAVERPMLAFK